MAKSVKKKRESRQLRFKATPPPLAISAVRKLAAPAATEVDAYIFIKENLRALNWDTRNPQKVPGGQVYTQNECLSQIEIKRLLGLERPENIVKITEKSLWVIEAKRSHAELGKAVTEAEAYARKLNQSSLFKVPFISGVAGNQHDTFLVHTRYLKEDKYVPVSINGIEMTGLLSPENAAHILLTENPNIDNPPIDERLFIAKAEYINEILHLGAVNPHMRANVMAALLLSKLSSTGPNIEEESPAVLIEDINNRVRNVLKNQRKPEFEEYIRIPLPASSDNHLKFRQALVDTIQQLDLLNIKSAMNSGVDWLGAFYEVFLKYASWAQDLGIVLTPRHITRFIADVMSVRNYDIIYDPTCGTGGFLVAAFDAVKQKASAKQLGLFKRNAVFGVEQDSGIAALAVVNMIFRGDGKNNIIEGNAFAKFLKRTANEGVPTAKYVSEQQDDPPVTKVMMNPPFALKGARDKEFKFIDQALAQMEMGGTLFSVLPYAALVKPGKYQIWRKRQLLPNHTLLSVMTFPGDLFYPVGITSVGVFIRKGIPHDPNQPVLWIRALNDGLLKSKGKRLPNSRATNDLEAISDKLRAFLDNPNYRINAVNQFIKKAPIDSTDTHAELVPEAYLDQAEPTHQQVSQGMEQGMRDMLAFLVKINRVILKPDLIRQTPLPIKRRPLRWEKFLITHYFDLMRGNFHSIARLDEGEYPTISRVSTDNGLVGFYDKPAKARLWEPGTISVSTVSGDAFIQPVPFIATDNVVLCLPNEQYRDMPLPFLFFARLMIDFVKWRYSYGRQCYKGKFARTEITLPVKANGELDIDYMREVVESTTYWPLIKEVFE
jgi:type I restriction enzyme M protein